MARKTYLIDPDGNKILAKLINPDKVIKDELCELIMKDVLAEHERLEKLRERIWKRIERYQKQRARRKKFEYKQDVGLTLTNYANTLRVVIKRNDIERPNENLFAAKDFAKRCIWRWSKRSGSDFVRAVIEKTFNVGKKGFVDIKMLRRLQDIEFADKDWQRFKEMVTESIDVIETRRYIIFQKRDSINEDWETIKLTFKA